MSDRTSEMTKCYVRMVMPILSKPKDYRINAKAITDFLLTSDRKPTTMHVVLRYIVGFLIYADYLDADSAVTIRKTIGQGRRASNDWSNKAMSPAALHRAFLSMNVVERTFFSTMLVTGMRMSQVLELTTKDIELTDERIIHIRTTTQKSRESVDTYKCIEIDTMLPSGERYVELFREYAKVRNQRVNPANPDAPIFPNANGQHLSASWVHKVTQRVSRETGIEFSSHRLRHTFATIVANSLDIGTASSLLDHQDVNMTKKYVRKERQDMPADKIRSAINNYVQPPSGVTG